MTPYREPGERPVVLPSEPAAPVAGELRCARCDVAVSAEERRCPKCLRRSSLVGPGAPARRSGALSVWPETTTCPLCANERVGARDVFLRVQKLATDVGSRSVTLLVRLRACDACHARARRLDQLRPLAGVGFVLGMLMACGFIAATLAGALVGALGVVMCVIALGGTVRANGRFRAGLDRAGITDALGDLVPEPRGLFHIDARHVTAKPPEDGKAAELADLLR